MSDQETEFENYLTNLAISQESADFWRERFYKLEPTTQEQILVLFNDFPNDIDFFTDLQKQKEQALRDKDTKAWDALLTKEAEFIADAYSKNIE